ncbi:MAG TPA: hypothetical protein VMC05_07055, partial [Xanthobacteraceae bacterium]|nr:hypothetical protein [Xanthobacteraceae bacterium]
MRSALQSPCCKESPRQRNQRAKISCTQKDFLRTKISSAQKCSARKKRFPARKDVCNKDYDICAKDYRGRPELGSSLTDATRGQPRPANRPSVARYAASR